jgi:hypothetical protein
VLWVEGPSDVIYWRFWLTNEAKRLGVSLVEGFDYSFMFSAGSLLANETLIESVDSLPSGTVNLLNLIGASRIIVDTDFNPGDEKARIDRDELEALVRKVNWRQAGFVATECRPFLKPRVRAIASAIDKLAADGNPSSIISTWGRETENALSDDAFRRTLKSVYSTSDGAANMHLETTTIEPWTSYENAILEHLELALSRPELATLTTELKDGAGIAQASVITDKVQFARHYLIAHVDVGSNLRPEADGIVEATLKWILKVRAAYLQ